MKWSTANNTAMPQSVTPGPNVRATTAVKAPRKGRVQAIGPAIRDPPTKGQHTDGEGPPFRDPRTQNSNPPSKMTNHRSSHCSHPRRPSRKRDWGLQVSGAHPSGRPRTLSTGYFFRTLELATRPPGCSVQDNLLLLWAALTNCFRLVRSIHPVLAGILGPDLWGSKLLHPSPFVLCIGPPFPVLR